MSQETRHDETIDEKPTGGQLSDTQPVFIIATERSGTNLVRSILNAHPSITAPHPFESSFPAGTTVPELLDPAKRRRLVRDIMVGKYYSHHTFTEPLSVEGIANRLARDDDLSFCHLQEAFYSEHADTVGSDTWVSKSPYLFHVFDEITAYYGNPKFVYLVRDARDVVLSNLNSRPGPFHPYFAAEMWRDEQEVRIDFFEDNEDATHLLQYESLLQNPKSVISDLCGFLDVEFYDETLEYYKSDEAKHAAKRSASFENLASPIKTDNYEKYRDQMTDEQVKIVEKVARDQLRYFDYDLVFSDAELDRFEFDHDRYQREERERTRSFERSFWLSNTRERLRQFARKRFHTYLDVRYNRL
jgi:hypothetical protein